VLSEKVLVTGGRGFVGSNLLKTLNLSKVNTLCIDEDYLFDSDWQDSLKRILDDFRPDTVFHVGACSDTLNQDAQLMMTYNFQSSKVIADWCQVNESKLIFSSSAATYGTNGSYPANLYGWSKYVAECYVVQKGGIALRYFNVYGPGEEQKGRMSSFFYQAYCSTLINNEVLLFPGSPRRDFVYVKDVVEANLHAMRYFNSLRSSWYEVGTGRACTFEQVLEIANISYSYAETSSVPHGYQYYTCSEPKNWMKGWQPQYSLENGISDYMGYLKYSK